MRGQMQFAFVCFWPFWHRIK